MSNLSALIVVIILVVFQTASAEEMGTGSGTVAEMMDVGSYTYIKLEERNVWIATTLLPVKLGEKIIYKGGMEMRDFYSKSLDRFFDSIIFVESVSQAGVGDMDSLHRSVSGNHAVGVKSLSQSDAVKSPEPGEITPLPDGMTVEEIVSNAISLNEKSVAFNAKVIKVNQNIVGKNWITLQDGTGKEPSNKLIATSQEMISPGAKVTVQGVVRNNVDIGSGYKYKVLLEQATFILNDETP
ncbi:MAG: hypothetical protein N0C81_03435 [Candidatus Thiodiazotropha lotti]|nr:hypothetical protein [Candidatus Thiodiazotropha lotti]MCG7923016.1 hypothetical protein [Candidatus Thiodiazotropha lotti]MCG8004721.1 hypothetical protein [Candidatus Thiodiazotropha lotti]MCG8006685.1 hypothetical protein [Candidatus Thiodiazotropha lotti]MCW4188348.1 hypothetical protein [Candidatus Thiodiazotropha lotti]